MNICNRYGSIYWQTACLSVNSGIVGDKDKSVEYNEIAKATNSMREKMAIPDINKSGVGFVPDIEKNKIMFGLKAIVGIGKNDITTILETRPYKSLEDFVERCELSSAKKVILLKSGALECLTEKDRRTSMIDLVSLLVPKREKVTMAQLSNIVSEIKGFERELEVWRFKTKYTGKKAEIDEEMESKMMVLFPDFEDYDYNIDGKIVINEQKFKKVYDKEVLELKNELKNPKYAEYLTNLSKREFWLKYCRGTVESWEGSTLLFYSGKQEMDIMPVENYFDVVDFNELSSTPVVVGYSQYKGRSFPQQKIFEIGGLIVGKEKAKKLIFVLTKSGVVTVRMSKQQFEKYDKKTKNDDGKIVDESWLVRGNLVVLVGYKRGKEFVLKNKNSKHSTVIYNIVHYNADKIVLKSKKLGNS